MKKMPIKGDLVILSEDYLDRAKKGEKGVVEITFPLKQNQTPEKDGEVDVILQSGERIAILIRYLEPALDPKSQKTRQGFNAYVRRHRDALHSELNQGRKFLLVQTLPFTDLVEPAHAASIGQTILSLPKNGGNQMLMTLTQCKKSAQGSATGFLEKEPTKTLWKTNVSDEYHIEQLIQVNPRKQKLTSALALACILGALTETEMKSGRNQLFLQINLLDKEDSEAGQKTHFATIEALDKDLSGIEEVIQSLLK